MKRVCKRVQRNVRISVVRIRMLEYVYADRMLEYVNTDWMLEHVLLEYV